MKTKVQLVEDFKDVWKYSTMQVQYVATVVLGSWVLMAPEQQAAILASIGLPPGKVVVVGAVMWLAANVLARVTKVTKAAPPTDQP